MGDEGDRARVFWEMVVVWRGGRSRMVVEVWSAASDRPETESESSATEK